MVEITKEEIEDCIKGINKIISFLEIHESDSGETYWNDKNGNGFHCDMGYFFEGLDEFEKYLKDQMQNDSKVNE